MKPKAAETSITIKAPIQKVWQAVTNTAAYPQWNPFVIRVDSHGDETTLGTKMKFYVKWLNGKGASSDEVVTDVKLPVEEEAGIKRAHWAYRYNSWMHYLGLVQAVRYHWLEQQPNGPTHYRTREEFNGLLRNFIPLPDVQDGFERQAEAMKKEVERLYA